MLFVFAVLGLVILLLAGDALVKGAVNLSLRVGMPAFLVSLTIVAFGTSAPELLIAVAAALEGVPGIAMGNVVGSNTANVLLVLGVPALIATMYTSECDTRKAYTHMLAATVLFIALAYRGVFDFWAGLILLAFLAFVLTDAVRNALKQKRAGKVDAELEEPEGADAEMPAWKISVFLALGMIGLPVGAQLLVHASEEIAIMFGVPETVIGLTLVALGTSLPELATTVMATIRRQADVALGNVIGSNMFNLLAIIGIASLIAPLPVARPLLGYDIWIMFASTLLLIPFVFFGRNIGRGWGLALTACYVLYIGSVFAG